MTDLKWLEEYSGQTTDELIALESEYRADSLVLAFEQALDQKSERIGKDNLSQEELVVLANEALEREVNNGGYDQFFFNSSNEYASIIVEALNHIGCPEAASLTQRAINSLGIAGAVTVDAIDHAMEEENEAREEILNECDDRYYETAGDLAGLLLNFIKQHRNKIILKL